MRGAILCLILLVSSISHAQSIVNGGFTSGTANWGCTPELNPETVYGGSNGANTVAEIDNLVSLCQTVSGFSIGDAYDVSYVASRRLGGCPGPNPATIGVTIAGLNTSDSRSNTIWALSPSTFTFTATAATHTLTLVHQFIAYTTCGFIIDDIAITASTPFDLRLTDFEITGAPDQNVTAKWVIATEQNQAKYEIESSLDGVNWEHWGEMESKGDASTPQAYELASQKATQVTEYYRLRAWDKNGRVQLLAIRQLIVSPKPSPVAFPNPSNGHLTIDFAGIEDARFELIDMLGTTQHVQPLVTEQDAVQLEVGHVREGCYLLRIHLQGKIFTQKLWLQKQL